MPWFKFGKDSDEEAEKQKSESAGKKKEYPGKKEKESKSVSISDNVKAFFSGDDKPASQVHPVVSPTAEEKADSVTSVASKFSLKDLANEDPGLDLDTDIFSRGDRERRMMSEKDRVAEVITLMDSIDDPELDDEEMIEPEVKPPVAPPRSSDRKSGTSKPAEPTKQVNSEKAESSGFFSNIFSKSEPAPEPAKPKPEETSAARPVRKRSNPPPPLDPIIPDDVAEIASSSRHRVDPGKITALGGLDEHYNSAVSLEEDLSQMREELQQMVESNRAMSQRMTDIDLAGLREELARMEKQQHVLRKAILQDQIAQYKLHQTLAMKYMKRMEVLRSGNLDIDLESFRRDERDAEKDFEDLRRRTEEATKWLEDYRGNMPYQPSILNPTRRSKEALTVVSRSREALNLEPSPILRYDEPYDDYGARGNTWSGGRGGRRARSRSRPEVRAMPRRARTQDEEYYYDDDYEDDLRDERPFEYDGYYDDSVQRYRDYEDGYRVGNERYDADYDDFEDEDFPPLEERYLDYEISTANPDMRYEDVPRASRDRSRERRRQNRRERSRDRQADLADAPRDLEEYNPFEIVHNFILNSPYPATTESQQVSPRVEAPTPQVPPKTPTSAEAKLQHNICPEYQYNRCKFDSDHYVQEKNKTLFQRHVCLKCYSVLAKLNGHPSSSTKCPARKHKQSLVK